MATPKPMSKTGSKKEIVKPGKKKILGKRKIPPTTRITIPAERLPAISTSPIMTSIIGQEKITWKIPRNTWRRG